MALAASQPYYPCPVSFMTIRTTVVAVVLTVKGVSGALYWASP
jgi:hypothetical protein